MRVDERFLNPAGIVQGGFLSAMMDSAMGASAVLSVAGRKVFVANTEMKSSFLRPVRAGDAAHVHRDGLEARYTWWPSSVRRSSTRTGISSRRASSTYLIKERQG